MGQEQGFASSQKTYLLWVKTITKCLPCALTSLPRSNILPGLELAKHRWQYLGSPRLYFCRCHTGLIASQREPVWLVCQRPTATFLLPKGARRASCPEGLCSRLCAPWVGNLVSGGHLGMGVPSTAGRKVCREKSFWESFAPSPLKNKRHCLSFYEDGMVRSLAAILPQGDSSKYKS